MQPNLNYQKKPALPHHIEAERSVLGAILLHNALLPQLMELDLEARDFYLDAHQKIFESILILFDKNSPIDLVTLTAQLRNKGWFETAGGSIALTALFVDCFSAGHAVTYAELVKEKAILRRIIETASEMTSQALQNDQDSADLIDEVERKVLSIANQKRRKSSATLKEVFLGNIQTIENLYLKKSDIIGLPTGFREFDQLTGGLRAGQLMILAARPAMGKTSMLLSMAQNAVRHDPDAVVIIFSLEMSQDELGFRLLSSSTQISASKIKVGNLSPSDWPQLLESSKNLSSAKIHIDDEADLSVMDVKARCRRVFAQEKRIDLIVIDYLQLLKGARHSQRNDNNREREVSEISRSLKSLAKELKVPVIALSQLNRSLESRPNKRPLLSDLRESGSIEADADIVAFIYRDEVYHPECEEKGIAELIVAKHRAGPTGTVKLRWLPQFTSFADLENSKVRRLPVAIEVQ
jgi:replicative DNA helicase